MADKPTELISKIRDALQNSNELDIALVLLFGSQARGDASDESDVDLVVVLNRNTPFGSFPERMQTVIQIRKRLKEISQRYGLDLLVYSKPEWDDFLGKKTAFAREIESTGLKVA